MNTKSVKTLYDSIGAKYQRNKSLGVSHYTELPAILALAGDLRGKRVLDAGCGPGRHAKRLLEAGARVTGIDISSEMVRLAEEHCRGAGRAAEFFQADFEQAAFRPASFDVIIASLSLMYAKDLNPVFENFGRWLKRRGRLVFSLYHPVRFFQKIADFDFSKSRKVWIHLEGCDVTVFNYYHPLGTYFDALRRHAFAVERVVEPVLSRRYKGWPEDNYRVPRSIIIEASRRRAAAPPER